MHTVQWNVENPEGKRRDGACWLFMQWDACWENQLSRCSLDWVKNLPLQRKIGRCGSYNVSLRSTKPACLEVHRLSRVFHVDPPSLWTLVFADWFKSGLWPTRATRPSKPENLEMDLKFDISRWSVKWILVFAWISMVFVTCNLWSVI